MKKNYFKCVLAAAMLMAGTSGWAQDASYTFDEVPSSFTIADAARASFTTVNDATLASNVLKFSCGNMNAVALGTYKFTDLLGDATSVSEVTVDFDMYVTEVAGHVLVSLADADYHNLANGGFISKSNTGYGANGSILSIGCRRANSAQGFYINSTKQSQNWNNQWIHVTATVDVAKKKVSYTIANQDKSVTLEGADVAYNNASAVKFDQIDFYSGTNATGNQILMDNLTVTVKHSETLGKYTVKFVGSDGTTELKPSETRSAAVGSTPAPTPNDLASWFTDTKDKKYIWESTTASDVVASDGSTTLTLKYREAAKYKYSVKTNLSTTLAQGSDFEQETIVVGYPVYINQGGNLYTKGSTNKEFRYWFTLNSDNQVETLNYNDAGIGNVVFYTEAEDIPGLARSASGNTAVRSSNAFGGYNNSDANVAIVTLPAGSYTITGVAGGGGTSNTQTFYAADNKLGEIIANSSNWATGTFDLDVTEPTTIYLAPGGSSTAILDFVYVVGKSTTVSINADSHLASYSNATAVTVPEDVDIYVATAANAADGVTLTKVASKVIPANTGVILYSAAGGDKTLTYGGTPTTADFSGNLLKGTAGATLTADGSQYVLLKGEQSFAQVSADVVIPANKAYLTLSAAAAKVAVNFGGEATAISAVKVAEDTQAVYNLAGQKVSDAYKGIVIKGGKKYIAK